MPCSPQAAKLQPALPVLEEATEPEGNELGNRLQDEDNSEDIIANLQGFIKDLWCGQSAEVGCQLCTNRFALTVLQQSCSVPNRTKGSTMASAV